MEVAPPQRLLEQVRGLPGAGALRDRLAPDPPVHLVGGAVRDLLLGRPPRELDVVIEGDPRPLAGALGEVARAHDRFGTLTVLLGGQRYDIARARRERYEHPGALPIVEPGTLAEDLRRRDFTVNALAIALNGPDAGRLTAVSDPSGRLDAVADLDAGILRVLHPASFRDDPTRLLRLARYAGRLGFTPDGDTVALAREAVASGALDTVSGPRIGAELRLLAREADAPAELAALEELGITAALGLPTGHDGPGLSRRALELLPDDGRPDLVVVAAAALGADHARLEALLDRLAYPAPDRTVIARAAAGATGTADRLAATTSASEIDAAVARAPLEEVALAGALGPGPAARRWFDELRHVQLEITGDDLVAAGVPPGPAIGVGLRAARAARLDGHAGGREEELAEARRAAALSG